MKSFISCISLLLLFQVTTFAQHGKPMPKDGPVHSTIDKDKIQIKTRSNGVPVQHTIFDLPQVDYSNLPYMGKALKALPPRVMNKAKNGMPNWIKGQASTPPNVLSPSSKAFHYLDEVKSKMQIIEPAAEFSIQKIDTDAQAQNHIRMQQQYQGIKVYGSEVILHEKEGAIHLLNGHYYPTPQIEVLTPSFLQDQAENLVKEDVSLVTNVVNPTEQIYPFSKSKQFTTELVIYHMDQAIDTERLAWHITIIPNLSTRWEYFIDAQNGSILHKYQNACQLHGWHPDHATHKASAHVCNHSTKELSNVLESNIPFAQETANRPDLLGINRTIDVWREGGTYYLIDGARSMFNAAQTNIPEEAVGVIATFDAFNEWPFGNNSNVALVSKNNNTSWNPKEVSAHYNAKIAYEYFENTFGRNSIKNQGENIFSIINVPDENGNDMDNAFWNGEAMSYGNGAQAFNAPLAKALDVAGHEMSHGVVQSTANLAYQGESGAMNEAFADIFGAMIDRNDWKVGEDIANPSVFPSGSLRDMSNPHNGGNSSNFYWQPDKVSEQYTGSQDNGGVHINSGIPNYAFFRFATNSSVGKARAEQVFYKALTDYLVMSSQFVDLRIAVLQAASDLYGANSAVVSAAANAFDIVEIFGDEPGGDYQTDIPVNPGADFVLWSDDALSNVRINDPQIVSSLLTTTSTNHISRASISDDGRYLDFVGDDKNLIEVRLDWSNGTPTIDEEVIVSTDANWRNVAISKDGNKLAALAGDLSQNDFDNEIFIFDFISETGVWFELTNPTFSQGISTGDVEYADVIEWDPSGQYILYDASNKVESTLGADLSYWDIGIIRVWDNASNDFADSDEPQIQKVFSSLPENVSVGNPTYAKNSPYIIAFDYIDSGGSSTAYSVYGYNTQTGDQGVIWESNTLGFPSYSPNDEFILFSFLNSGEPVIAGRALTDSKIAGTGDGFLLVEDAKWGHWFAIGERDLTSTADLTLLDKSLTIAPNPVADFLSIQFETEATQGGEVVVYDILGNKVVTKVIQSQNGLNRESMNLTGIAAGTYTLQLRLGNEMISRKLMKF